MNQSVIFPDRHSWCEQSQQIQFPVQVNGLLIECFISLPVLEKISAQVVCAERALEIFSLYRIDIEEIAEEIIELENYNEQGHIEVIV